MLQPKLDGTFVGRQIATTPTVLTDLLTGPCYLAIPSRASHNWIDGVTSDGRFASRLGLVGGIRPNSPP